MRLGAVLPTALLGWVLLVGARPEPWTIQRDASSIVMSVNAFGTTSTGRFEDWRGDIAFDPASPRQTQATVTVQAASLRLRPAVATAPATGPAFLDVVRHPTIRVQLRALEPTGGDRHTARADVTMKGVTRPVIFPVDLRVTGDSAQMTGEFTVDRSAFGIGTSGLWNSVVARQVTVRVSLQARRN